MTEISNRSKMWYLFPATAPASQTIQEKSEQDTRLHVTDLDNTWSQVCVVSSQLSLRLIFSRLKAKTRQRALYPPNI